MRYERGRPWKLGHVPGLDGLRGLAILLVLACHLSLPLSSGAGMAGVTLFFVLSGFLITSLLVRECEERGRISFGGFYRRRARRLLPALGVLLVMVTVVDIVSGDATHVLQRVLPAAFYGYNWVCVSTSVAGDPIGQVWSLAIEEQFYLLWPLLLFATLRWRGCRAALSIALGGAACALLLRLGLFVTGASAARIYFASDTNALSLMLGCALALAATQGWLPALRRLRWMLPALLVVAAVSATTIYSDTFAFLVGDPLLVSLAGAVLVMHIIGRPSNRLFAHPMLRGAGALSYSLYLWHTAVITWLLPRLATLPWAASRALLAMFIVGAAAVSYRYVEQPLRSRRRRPVREAQTAPSLLPATL